MKILITGSSGLVGRNIIDVLSKKFTLYTPSSRELNLLDLKNIEEYLSFIKPDFIIHCAGLVGGIQANIERPVEFLSINSYIALNLINTAYRIGIRRILNLASSCMYPRNAENPLKEVEILSGSLEPTNEGYALAKILSTRLCEYYNTEYSDCEFKTIIPCNLYGIYDKFEDKVSHMIPNVIKKIHHAKINKLTEIEIWGSGNARREFMFAKDLAEFIEFGINNFEKLPNVMNLGLGYDYSINDYYNKISEIIGFKGSFSHNESKPEGMKRKLVNIDFQTQLGWKPRFSLDEGIQYTYRYYLEEYKLCNIN